ncbi:MAG: hypothetical protein ACO3PX_17995, partial [bacterium]
METSIPHTPHQNGMAERIGGVVWEGGAALRYGGNLLDTDWLYCCEAFVHVRNRLPNSKTAGRKDRKTPFELMNDVQVDQLKLVNHFRRLGSLCYVVTALNTRKGKPKRSFRAAFMGYTHESGQKGFRVRRLIDGKMIAIAPERLSKCFEFSLCFGKPPDYDAWLRRSVKKRNKTVSDANDVDGDSAFESLSASDSAFESEIESESEREHVASDMYVPAYASDDESETERISESESDEPERMSDNDEENKHDDMPSLSPTRSKMTETMSEMDEKEDGDATSDEIVSENDNARNAETLTPLNEVDSIVPDNDSAEVNSSSNDDDEYEVDSILSFRRVGKKRGKIEYLTKWVGGEETWEPAGSFRLGEPDSDETGNTHLPVFEEFRSKMADGLVSEFTGLDS